MLKNKLFIVLISIVFSITMILTASFVLYQLLERSESGNEMDANRAKTVSADQIKEHTVLIENIGTNMAGLSNYIRLSIAFELDSKKSRQEFVKVDFKVKDFIIRNLSDLTPKELQGKENLDQFTASLIARLNQDILTYGKVEQIYITDIVMQ